MRLTRPSPRDVAEYAGPHRDEIVEWLRRQPLERRRRWIRDLTYDTDTLPRVSGGAGIAYVQNDGTKTGTLGLGASNIAMLNVLTSPTVGNLIVMTYSMGLAGSARTITSVQTSGATWTVDQQVDNGTTGLVCIASTIYAGSVLSVTVNFSGQNSSQPYNANFEEFSGVAATTPFDVGNTATGTGTALTAGTTAAVSAADLSIGAWGILAVESSFTAGSGYTAFGIVSQTGNAVLGQYKLGVSGAQSATGTAGTTGVWSGAQATYLPSGANPAPVTPVRTNWIYLRRNR